MGKWKRAKLLPELSHFSGQSSVKSTIFGPLIPGLPDDVVLYHILTRISWKCFLSLPALNRRWLKEFRSKRVYKCRSLANTAEHLMAAILYGPRNHCPRNQCNGILPERCAVGLSSLSGGTRSEWFPLPPIPWIRGGVPLRCALAFLEGTLYVFGGSDFFPMDKEGVLSFDECPSALVFQMDFGAGRGAWEIATTLSWFGRLNSFVCKVDEGKIHLTDWEIMDNVLRFEICAYDPVLNLSTCDSFALTQPPSPRSLGRFPDGTAWARPGVLSRSPVARVNGTLYGVEKEGVSVWDSVSGEWHVLPSTMIPSEQFFGDRDMSFSCLEAIPFDGELVVLVSWTRGQPLSFSSFFGYFFHMPPDVVFAVIMSRGLCSSAKQTITWKMVEPPHHLVSDAYSPNERCGKTREGNISLSFFCKAGPPQVFPLKL